MAQCGRCGAESNELHTIMPRGNKGRRRERICPGCLAEALENTGLTAVEIAQDNARWDRIFAEKFADPDYYAGRVPFPQSSFGAFADQMAVVCDRQAGRIRPARREKTIRRGGWTWQGKVVHQVAGRVALPTAGA